MSTSETLASALSDRYRIERELGAGGMATVFLAHDVLQNVPELARRLTRGGGSPP